MVRPLDVVYLGFTTAFALAGSTIVWFAIRAYPRTENRSILLLALGFGLTVAGHVTSLISAFLTDFSNPRTLLTTHSLVTTVGFVLIVFSLWRYQ